MGILLLGRWNHGGDLVIEDSHYIPDGDQDGIDAVVAEQDNDDGMAWACEFDVDRHRDAVQRAYEEYARDADARIIDEFDGVEPVTF